MSITSYFVQSLNIPIYGQKWSRMNIAIVDIVSGLGSTNIWSRLGWRETRRRYRRTIFGPFWTAVSLGIFVVSMGLVWAGLWKQEPAVYLPFLTAGMIVWVMISSIASDSCGTFISAELLVKQLRISYTLLAAAVVWRNMIVFFHNLLIFAAVFIYSGMSFSWAMLLVVPGLLLLGLNSVWIGLVLGMLCARIRDIQQLITNLLQISMFLTPVFWTPEQIPGRLVFVVDYNILFHYIEMVRRPLLGQVPSAWSYCFVLLVTIGGWAVAIALLNRFRHRLPYWL